MQEGASFVVRIDSRRMLAKTKASFHWHFVRMATTLRLSAVARLEQQEDERG